MTKNTANEAFELVDMSRKLEWDIKTLNSILDSFRSFSGNLESLIGIDISNQEACGYVPLSKENIKQLVESKRTELKEVQDKLEAL